jgi:1-deoxy-D-xylulose-5-phosphate synthase
MTPGKATETPVLDSLTSIEKLRDLSQEELPALCEELRYDLMHRVNQVGGHFASSLGVTELTVALHYAFNTPFDRIVWDVGHQAYVHKILTGRREDMLKVRTLGGISGFPRRQESDFDTFGVAHAGTSISAALGMLEADSKDASKDTRRKAVAVIGDGAMTAGMAFEALNHAGHLHKNLIVVLNDNEMSIAPNVGAISLAFSSAVTNYYSTIARRHFKSLTERGLIPKTFYRVLDKAEEATQGFLSTPGMLFGSFGFRYIGPIDGHNIEQLITTFERAGEQDGPVLVHVLTTKGKGYEPAEEDPVGYHAISPNQIWSNPAEGVSEAKKISNKKKPTVPARVPYTKVFGQAIVDLCKKDQSLVGITAAMPDGTGLQQLAKEMPERFYDVGIAEQHAVTFAAGMACEGMHPVCAIYSTFLQRAFDQVVHDVCIQNLPVIFAMDRAGLVGSDGPTHHGVFDISYLRSLPNMVLMAPKDEGELRDMLYTASQYKEGPIALRYPRGSGVGVDINREMRKLEIGRGEALHTSGENAKVAFVALGAFTYKALAASRILESDYTIPCTVINPRFIKPLDQDLISKTANTHELLVTIEDGSLQGGFGSAVLELLSEHSLQNSARVVRIGIPDQFIEHGTQEELYEILGMNTEGIIRRVLEELDIATLTSGHSSLQCA